MNIPFAENNTFQSYLNKQRKDKFVMVFSLPEALKPLKDTIIRDNDKVLPDTVQFSIYGSVIPDISIPEIEIPYSGQVLKVSGMSRPSYPNNTVNFTIDNMFNNFWVLYKWLQLFNDERYSTSTGVNTIDLYSTTITIFGLDEYNNKIIQFNFYNSFPVTLGGIKYSDRDSDEMMSTFDFTYSQFKATLL